MSIAQLFLSLVLAQPAPHALPAQGSDEWLLAAHSESFVTIRYVLEEEGAEFGGFTQRSHLRASGLMVDAKGLVLMGGEIFPSEDFGEDGTQRLVEFEVETSTGKAVAASLLGLDRDHNLVFLEAESRRRLPHISFQFDTGVEIGEELRVMGRLPEGFGGSPLVKHVRVAGRTGEGYWVFEDLLDLRFLGGPVFDSAGRCIGFIGVKPTPPGIDPQADPEYFPTFMATVPQAKRFGLPVGIPASLFQESLRKPSALAGPEIKEKSWIGITLQPVSVDLAEFWGLPSGGGIAVTSVVENSPAEKAGLRTGDVVISFDGEPVAAKEESELTQFIRRVQRTGIGRPVPLEVFRDGRAIPVEIRLGRAPMPMRTAPFYINTDFGLKVRELTFDFLQRTNLPQDLQGVVVEELESGGWSQVGGLRVGDVIRRAQEQPVGGVEDLRELLESAREEGWDEVVFFVQRGPNTEFVSVQTDY